METEAKDHRPSWDEYFMTLATEVATRTTCLRRGVGALIVKDRRILATGYNGVPTGLGALPRNRLPAPAAGRAQRPAPRDLPRPARRAERHHPGGALRHQHHGRFHLHHHAALRGVREDAHQRRHHRDRLPESLSRRAGHVHARGSRHEAARLSKPPRTPPRGSAGCAFAPAHRRSAAPPSLPHRSHGPSKGSQRHAPPRVAAWPPASAPTAHAPSRRRLATRSSFPRHLILIGTHRSTK